MKKKILLAVLIVVILLGSGVAYAYFATDIFKTEKELFFSYMKDENAWANFEEEKLVEYANKQENTAYTNKGEASVNISGIEDESIDMLSKSKITFEGKTNVAQKLADQTLTIDFGQGFNIPVNIKCDGDTFGIQSDFLDSKFIAIRNENLKALAKRFGMESDEIPDKIEIEDSKFTEEEIKKLVDKYNRLFDENLTDDLFSKEKVDNQTVITLSMNGNKVIDLLKKLLETVRDDEIILSKLSTEYVEQFKEMINELLDDMDTTTESENSKFEMKLYIESKKVSKCEILAIGTEGTKTSAIIENTENQISVKGYDDSELMFEMILSKEKSQNDVTYKIAMKTNEYSETEINVTLQYKNLLELDNVQEVCNVEIKGESASKYLNDSVNDDVVPTPYTSKEKMTISVNYENTKTFSSDLQIEKFEEDNSIILNDATDNELQTLILNIYQKLGLI